MVNASSAGIEITIGQAEAKFFTVVQLLQVFFCDKTALLSGNGMGKKCSLRCAVMRESVGADCRRRHCAGWRKVFVRFQPVVRLKRQNRL